MQTAPRFGPARFTRIRRAVPEAEGSALVRTGNQRASSRNRRLAHRVLELPETQSPNLICLQHVLKFKDSRYPDTGCGGCPQALEDSSFRQLSPELRSVHRLFPGRRAAHCRRVGRRERPRPDLGPGPRSCLARISHTSINQVKRFAERVRNPGCRRPRPTTT
jgi:hypothetical protein